jgi:hypothetical protein
MIIYHYSKCQRIGRYMLWISICVYLSIVYDTANAQQQPPRPLKVTTFQNMNFGTIILGNSGGTVILSPSGIRSKTGDVILPSLGSQGNEAIFEVKATPGTLITITFGSTTLSNGGHNMTLVLGPCTPLSPYVNTLQSTGTTDVHVGGTLTVGNPSANPAGNYSGSFTVTFIQQ